DPDSAPIHRALGPLYLALGRSDDALQACKHVLQLVPEDFEAWAAYGRHLKNRGQLKEARDAYQRALHCKDIVERFDLHLQIQYDLAALCEGMELYDEALEAFAGVVKSFESDQAPVELDSMAQSDIAQQAARTIERMIKLCIKA